MIRTPKASSSAPSTGSGKPESRLAMLDLLRFGAASAVVAYHFTARPNQAFGTDVQNVFPRLGEVTLYGAAGVELFFVISGFVILSSVWGRSTEEFAASRVSRLFPAYWCAVIITTALVLLFRPSVLVDDATIGESVANLTMVQTAVGAAHIDGVYWTLWTELKFYVLIGVLSLVGLTRNRVIAFATLWPIVAGMANQAENWFLSGLLCSGYSVFFSAGMLMYLVYREGHSLLLWLLIGMQWALGMNFATSALRGSLEKSAGEPLASWPLMLAVTLCFALVAAVTLTPLSRPSWKWMTWLGALTYPVYLIHQNWGWMVISSLHERIGQLPALAAAVCIVFASAVAIHVFVERPLAPRLRAAVRDGLRPAAPPAPRHSRIILPRPQEQPRRAPDPDHAGLPVG